MSEEWMAERDQAGAQLAKEHLNEGSNPVHVGVELGKAIGVLAADYNEIQGRKTAEAFLETVAAVLNLELTIAGVENLRLKMEKTS